MRVSEYPCVVKQLANPGRLFICVFIINSHIHIKVLRPYFNDVNPACGGADHLPAGHTNIITNDCATCVLFAYRLDIDLLYYLLGPHAPNLTVLVLLLSYVAYFHRESFSF